jgi:hypothetical protein
MTMTEQSNTAFRRAVTCLLTAACLTPLTCSFAEDHALLIGINDYVETEFASLEGAHNDVELMQVVLERRFGIPAHRIRMLLDEKATHQGLQQAFADLAQRIGPGDSVYIHYSGHGSYTPDLNGDERSGKDQTWVSHGSRHPDAGDGDRNINSYDVLDDEIEAWLAPLAGKAGTLVFVSDSCHSASVTRGDAPLVRSAPADERPHPLGDQSQGFGTVNAIRIGAARDVQGAAEFVAEDGIRYGMFTWFWAQALDEASAEETWYDVFRRTAMQVQLRRGDSQQPQIEGGRSERLFGGNYEQRGPTVMVSRASANGQRAWIDAGLLSGMTADSEFGYPDDPENSARLRLVRVLATESEAAVLRGRVAVGDRVEEVVHAYPFPPVTVFVAGDFIEAEDRDLANALVAAIAKLPDYSVADTQTTSDLVLYVARPGRDANGDPVYAGPDDTLPLASKNSDPEVWVMSPVEQLIHDDLRIDGRDPQRATKALMRNLKRLARVREVQLLGNSDTADIPVSAYATLLTPVDLCGSAGSCVDLGELGNYAVAGRFELEELEEFDGFASQQILTYTLNNDSRRDYYVYLLSISANGTISMLFPAPGERADIALIGAGDSLNTFEEGYGHLLEQPGGETVKLIASREPIDISLLEQTGYERGDARPRTPLEKLLANAMSGSRGAVRIRNDAWGTRQVSFSVAAASAE